MQITPYAIFTEDEYRGPVCELYGGSHFHGAGVLRLNHPAEHYVLFFFTAYSQHSQSTGSLLSQPLSLSFFLQVS